MRLTRFLIVVCVSSIGLLSVSQKIFSEPGERTIALVYSDAGTCSECVTAAAAIAEKLGLRTRMVNSNMIHPSLFQNAAIWIQPGGNAITVARHLSRAKMQMIRRFISHGGSYLGFCAGGFLTDRWVDDAKTLSGLNLSPVQSYDYSKVRTPQLLSVTWTNQVRQMYFEDGPAFDEPVNGEATVVARYADRAPAALTWNYGNGTVAVSGPHPEAQKEWFVAEHLVRQDGFETDEDLALNLMKSILPEPIKRAPACSEVLQGQLAVGR